MISKWKSGNPLRELGPLDLSKRLWLSSECTKVTWKPLWWRSFASSSIGVMWPCSGCGTQTTWGLVAVASVMEPIFLSLRSTYTYIYIYMGQFRDIKLIPALSFYRLSSKHNRAFTYIVFLSFSRQTTVWQWTLPQAIVPNLQII